MWKHLHLQFAVSYSAEKVKDAETNFSLHYNNGDVKDFP